VEPPDSSYRDVQLALRFTIGLNSSYSAYKQYYEDGLKDWHESLVDDEEAFPKNFEPKFSEISDQDFRILGKDLCEECKSISVTVFAKNLGPGFSDSRLGFV
jgi:hypothetical protein